MTKAEQIAAIKKRIRMCQPPPNAGSSERKAVDEVRAILLAKLAELEV